MNRNVLPRDTQYFESFKPRTYGTQDCGQGQHFFVIQEFARTVLSHRAALAGDNCAE